MSSVAPPLFLFLITSNSKALSVAPPFLFLVTSNSKALTLRQPRDSLIFGSYQNGPQVPFETLLNFSSYWLNNTLYMITYVRVRIPHHASTPLKRAPRRHSSPQPRMSCTSRIPPHTHRLQEATLDPIPVCIELNMG